MRKALRVPVVFGGAAVTLMGGLGGAVMLQGVAGATPTTWAHNTTAIRVGTVYTGVTGPKFKATMTNHEGTTQTGELCVDYYTQTPTHPTTTVLKDFTCTATDAIKAGDSITTAYLADDDWLLVAGKWKEGGTTVSQVESLTFRV